MRVAVRLGGGADNLTCRTTTRPTAWSTPARTTTTPRAAGGMQPVRPSAPTCSPIWASMATTSPGDLIRVALASVADTAIVPMQDVLALAARARMNLPGQGDGWWTLAVCVGTGTQQWMTAERLRASRTSYARANPLTRDTHTAPRARPAPQGRWCRYPGAGSFAVAATRSRTHPGVDTNPMARCCAREVSRRTGTAPPPATPRLV